MQFRDEYELQAAVADWLEDLGYSISLEVPAGGGRVDILTDEHLIEIKPTLNRNSLYQAAGQLGTYKSEYPSHIPVIAGLTPSDENSSRNIAAILENTQNIEVWYLDDSQEFIDFILGEQVEDFSEDYAPANYYEDYIPTYTTSYGSGGIDSDQIGGVIALVVVAILGIGIAASLNHPPISRYGTDSGVVKNRVTLPPHSGRLSNCSFQSAITKI